jgi:transposase
MVADVETRELFALALGVSEPWYVASIDLSPEQRQLEIALDFRRGGKFRCPKCGAADCKAYDSEERRWHHEYRSLASRPIYSLRR